MHSTFPPCITHNYSTVLSFSSPPLHPPFFHHLKIIFTSMHSILPSSFTLKLLSLPCTLSSLPPSPWNYFHFHALHPPSITSLLLSLSLYCSKTLHHSRELHKLHSIAPPQLLSLPCTPSIPWTHSPSILHPSVQPRLSCFTLHEWDFISPSVFLCIFTLCIYCTVYIIQYIYYVCLVLFII